MKAATPDKIVVNEGFIVPAQNNGDNFTLSIKTGNNHEESMISQSVIRSFQRVQERGGRQFEKSR